MSSYSEDYPSVIKNEVIIKTIIGVLMVGIEAVLVFKMKMYNACKPAYGLKLVKIVFIFYQAFINDQIL